MNHSRDRRFLYTNVIMSLFQSTESNEPIAAAFMTGLGKGFCILPSVIPKRGLKKIFFKYTLNMYTRAKYHLLADHCM